MAYFSNSIEKIDFDIRLGHLNIKVVNINKVAPRIDWKVLEHEHSDFEIHIIPSGRGYINIQGCDFIVNGGEFYITGPMIRHSQLTDSQNPMMEYCIELEINISENKSMQNSFSYEECAFLKDTFSKIYPYAFKDSFGLASCFEEILLEAKEQNACYLLKIQVTLLKLIMDLLKTICNHENIIYQSPPTENSVDANRIQRIIKYIDANYKEHIVIENISNIILLSPRQINRLMKKTFNQTFHEYLLTFRLHMAEKLLMNSSLSIEEVAYESGFSSHYYMYQAFKHKGKIPPGQHRVPKKPS